MGEISPFKASMEKDLFPSKIQKSIFPYFYSLATDSFNKAGEKVIRQSFSQNKGKAPCRVPFCHGAFFLNYMA